MDHFIYSAIYQICITLCLISHTIQNCTLYHVFFFFCFCNMFVALLPFMTEYVSVLYNVNVKLHRTYLHQIALFTCELISSLRHLSTYSASYICFIMRQNKSWDLKNEPMLKEAFWKPFHQILSQIPCLQVIDYLISKCKRISHKTILLED